MVVRIIINVKHIRGNTFQLDVDNESDSLGLKVQIWEQHHIPIENQRLVFAGRELQDGVKLSSYDITDDATIFLVESTPQQSVQLVSVPPKPAPPAYAPLQQEDYDPPIIAVQVPSSVNGYAPVTISEKKISTIVDLAFWIRFYCISSMLLCGAFVFIGGYYFLIPTLMYLFGWIGTRKLNRCCLIFPNLLCALIGFGGFICSISWMIHDFMALELFVLLFSILHICIFACICKLISFINRASLEEFAESRRRIVARGCICCC